MSRRLTIKEIQRLELDMLVAFDAVCKANNLYYTLCGGTLLGAVRHRGFIPWDDDIDVMMPRPYFDKLCKLIKDGAVELPNSLRFLSCFTTPSLNIPFVKIVNEKTLVSEEFMEADRNLWIDIFVSDGCPENTNEIERMFKTQRWLRWLLYNKQTRPGTGKTKLKAFFKDIVRNVLRPVDPLKICQKLEKLSSTYTFEECDLIACIQWGYGPQEVVKKSEWIKPISVEFEGLVFPAPSNYDDYLKNLYGDYMTLPPEEKRTCHDMTVELLD